MAVVGEIAVNVAARTTNFVKGMRRSATAANKFSKGLKRSIAPLSKFSALLGGVGITSAVVGFTRIAKSIDQIAKDAARLSITTQALQELNFAAGIYGATSEDITKAITRQQKAISEANVGLMTQKRGFDQLGLSVTELSELSADQAFEKIRSALHDVRTETDKTRIAMDLWGRGGAKLLALVNASEKDFRKQTRAMRELNATFSAEEAAKVEAFNDELLRLKTLIGGQLAKLVIDISPQAIAGVKALQAYVVEAAKLIKQVAPVLSPEDAAEKISGFSKLKATVALKAATLLGLPGTTEEDKEAVRKAKERDKATKERLEQLKKEQELRRQTKRGVGIAGRSVLGTVRGALPAGEGAQKMFSAMSSQILSTTAKELTVGRFKRQKEFADAERATQTKRFEDLLGKISGGTGAGIGGAARGANRLIEATSAEGFAAIRKGRRPTEKLEKLGEDQLKELRTIATTLGKEDELQALT